METGSRVAIEYSVSLADGTRVESNAGGEPLEYEHGKGQILPALEQAVEGLTVGESERVELEPERAFGKVQDEAFREVPKDAVPENSRTPGTTLWMKQGEDAPPRQLRVHEVRDESIVLDFNHPLAGETVVFEVKLLSVTPAGD